VKVHLVRHGLAGTRPEWPEPDELRPLTPSGLQQAVALADLLATGPVKRVVTSRFLRCVQTVQPLADRLGVEVERHAALAEEAHVDATWALLEELAEGRADVAACSHGNVIPRVLERLHRQGGQLLTDGDWACAKGSVWTLETEGDTFVRARYTPPPALAPGMPGQL
jgi:phosphohistidine phosphatase SixA